MKLNFSLVFLKPFAISFGHQTVSLFRCRSRTLANNWSPITCDFELGRDRRSRQLDYRVKTVDDEEGAMKMLRGSIRSVNQQTLPHLVQLRFDAVQFEFQDLKKSGTKSRTKSPMIAKRALRLFRSKNQVFSRQSKR